MYNPDIIGLIWIGHQVLGLSDYNETCNIVQCYICGPLDENVCILGAKR